MIDDQGWRTIALILVIIIIGGGTYSFVTNYTPYGKLASQCGGSFSVKDLDDKYCSSWGSGCYDSMNIYLDDDYKHTISVQCTNDSVYSITEGCLERSAFGKCLRRGVI